MIYLKMQPTKEYPVCPGEELFRKKECGDYDYRAEVFLR